MSGNTKFVKLLVDFLREKYPETKFAQKTPTHPWLKLKESGSIIYINPSGVGWYDLDESIYKKITSINGSFSAIVLQKPEKTFILSKEKIKTIFTSENKLKNEKRPRWMFSIKYEDDNYYLKIKKKNININDYLNRWDLIPDFNVNTIEDSTKNYFLIQVKEIIDDKFVYSQNLKSDENKINVGDYLLLYFSSKCTHFKQQLKNIYRVDSVPPQNKDNIKFYISEIKKLNGILLNNIQEAQKNKILSDAFTNIDLKKFTIKQISKEDYESILLLDISNEINFSEMKIREIEDMLIDKKQIILYGPPGTSKTYLAKKFSEYFVKEQKENVMIVQFHPSYSYEDFIEGIKPKLSENGKATGFAKQQGIFKNLVDKCIKSSNQRFVLIIDEINRGNISRIFGELIYLLEYRNEKIHLTYSPTKEFFIPDNLYIIGTMNSADRSIAFVDYALRRRFYFIEFYHDEDILKKWFVKNGINESIQNNILLMVKEINSEISKKLGKEYQIGYSYFMNNLDYQKVKRIINYAIIPLVDQYFFSKKEDVKVIENICNSYLNKLSNFSNEEKKTVS